MTLEQESHDDAISVWSFCLRVTLKDHVFGNPKEKSNTYQSFFSHSYRISPEFYVYKQKSVYKGPKRGLPDFVGRVEVMGWGNGTSNEIWF